MSIPPLSSQIPDSSAPFFQEYHFEDLDVEKDSFVILERILSFGNREELAWLFHCYGKEKIENWVVDYGARRLPWRRYNLWCVLLDLPIVERSKIREPRAWPY
jgi:hypothetical protein